MFEIFLILGVSVMMASILGIGEKPPKDQGSLASRLEQWEKQQQWELTDETRAEKERRQQKECRTLLLLIPTILCFVPLSGGGLVASNQCAPRSKCGHVFLAEAKQFSDQYATALYNPGKVAKSIQPNLKIVFWVGMAFIYLHMLIWIIAASTLISLWVHDVRRPSER